MKRNDDFLTNYGIGGVKNIMGYITPNVSIDAGSSETRTHVWEGNPVSGDVYGISSGYSVVTQDISGVRSQTDTLYDNLEIVLTDETVGKTDKIFETIRIVKGGLFEDLRLPVARTTSNVGKGLQETTFVNAIANIGIRAYILAHKNKIAAECVEPRITLALPQEDITSAKRQEEAKKKLAGRYIFSLPRCNYTVKIVIKENEILLIDEAQAAMGYWRFSTKADMAKYQGVMMIDAGGRSVDLSIMLKGRVLAKGSATCKFGGQKFIDLVINAYVNGSGNDMPTRDMVLDALDTGLLQDGNANIDITEYIETAKKEIAANIGNDISGLLDVNELRMNQLNLVLCAGRLMRDSKNATSSVPPLTNYIDAYVKGISPNTEVGVIDEEFALVRGLSLARAAFDKKNAK